jgi:hypothetical protein
VDDVSAIVDEDVAVEDGEGVDNTDEVSPATEVLSPAPLHAELVRVIRRPTAMNRTTARMVLQV